MSNIFLKNDLENMFDSVTESSVALPTWLSIIDAASNTTNKVAVAKPQVGGQYSESSSDNYQNNLFLSSTSSEMFQVGGALKKQKAKKQKKVVRVSASATSSDVFQTGGAYSATSSDVFQTGGAYSATSSDVYQTGGAYSATSSDVFQTGGAYSATSSDVYQTGGAYSATSSDVYQTGGAYSATSSDVYQTGGNTSNDINKLISMLTSESSSPNRLVSETSTVSLENQLREILNQAGGAKKSTKKAAGPKKQRGGNPDPTFIQIDQSALATDIDSTTQSSLNINNILAVSDLVGGAKKSSKKSSKKILKNNEDLDGGVNAGFAAFLDLKKFIATQLGVSNGPKAAKVAGAVQREMKEKHPNLDAVKLAEEGKKHFEKNKDHFKQMLTK